MIRALSAVLILTLILGAPSLSIAEPLFPLDAYPDLDAKMLQHERQFYLFNALPFGLSLNAHIKDQASKDLVNQFLSQTDSDDVQAVTGSHPFELMSTFGEYGDLGFFGGVALMGTAMKYMTLKRDGGDADEIIAMRAAVVQAAESWHVFKVVTGGNGLVARGIRLLVPFDELFPAIPGGVPELIPLADESGNALPIPKDNGSWRAELSLGELPADTWIWVDSCSKDQLVGQIFAMTILYDAMKDDPDIDQALVTQLSDDAKAIATMLMAKHDISVLEGATPLGATTEFDLIIMDADGRPTMYHDFNALSLEKFYGDPSSPMYNLFNTIMAVGVMTGLYHMTGDAEIEAFLYEELLGTRGYLDILDDWQSPEVFSFLYMGLNTNTDVPDMTGVALWLALYHQTDPQVRQVLESFLEEAWWMHEGESHTAALSKMPFWHAIYLGMTAQGADEGVLDELVNLLLAFDLGPYWQDPRTNCDEDELAAMECLALDGETVLTLEGPNADGEIFSTLALDPSIRPNSDFNARSNPFRVNGGGDGLRLNPGGDLIAAYWMCRFMDKNIAGEVSISPFALDHMPVGGPVVAEPSPEAVEEVVDPLVEPMAEVVDEVTPSVDTVSPETSTKTDSVVPIADCGLFVDTTDEPAVTDKGEDDGCASAPGSEGSNRAVWLILMAFALLVVTRRRSSSLL